MSEIIKFLNRESNWELIELIPENFDWDNCRPLADPDSRPPKMLLESEKLGVNARVSVIALYLTTDDRWLAMLAPFDEKQAPLHIEIRASHALLLCIDAAVPIPPALHRLWVSGNVLPFDDVKPAEITCSQTEFIKAVRGDDASGNDAGFIKNLCDTGELILVRMEGRRYVLRLDRPSPETRRGFEKRLSGGPDGGRS